MGCRNLLMKQELIKTRDQTTTKVLFNILKNDPTYNQIIKEVNLNDYIIKYSKDDTDEIIEKMFNFG